ncbi:TPA: FAD-binding oxidoreductase [Escherichia coli]|nr:FAD-binding oxidoreductase [Escherichia coli]
MTTVSPSLDDSLEILRDADRMAPYMQDASGEAADQPPAQVARPRNTEEVAAFLRHCHEQGRPVCIQGGLTGLAGGAVPGRNEAVLTLERMNQVLDFDPVGGTVRVQAGMVLQALCDYVQERGWYFPMDLGARGSCQIGGNVATNAGGNRVLRYGTMRELVLGLEAVLADGTVLSMLNRGLKNNTGLDLKHLFIGTEGTLGVITQVVLRLFPLPQRRYSALLALEDFPSVVALLHRARGALAELSSFEVMWQDYLQAAAQRLDCRAPFDAAHPVYVLLEMEGRDRPESEALLEQFLGECLEAGVAVDAILPQSQEQAAQLWRLRDAIGEILSGMKPYVAFDVGIPLEHTDAFVRDIRQALSEAYPQARHLFFGHLGDGNLHLSTGPHAPDDLLAVEEKVYQAVQAVGGSISAEHGIGRIKKPFLHYSRNAVERDRMRAILQLLDPQQILNPGRVLDR